MPIDITYLIHHSLKNVQTHEEQTFTSLGNLHFCMQPAGWNSRGLRADAHTRVPRQSIDQESSEMDEKRRVARRLHRQARQKHQCCGFLRAVSEKPRAM